MRYEIVISNDDDQPYCIRDGKRSEFKAGDPEQNGGDVVCLRPACDEHELSERHWPENARLIVALLNWAHFNNFTVADLEHDMRNEGHIPMQIPGDRVEFSDDIQHRETQPDGSVLDVDPSDCLGCDGCAGGCNNRA